MSPKLSISYLIGRSSGGARSCSDPALDDIVEVETQQTSLFQVFRAAEEDNAFWRPSPVSGSTAYRGVSHDDLLQRRRPARPLHMGLQ